MPDSSPAATMFTIMLLKILGCLRMEPARVWPFSMSACISRMAAVSFLFSVCWPSMDSTSEMDTPARSMETNCRQKIAMSLEVGLPRKGSSISRLRTFSSLISKIV